MTLSSTDKPSSAHAPAKNDGQESVELSSHSGALPNRPRKFIVQPIETTSRSSRKAQAFSTPKSTQNHSKASQLPPIDHAELEGGRARRRFLPEVIETTKASNRGTALANSTPFERGHSGGTVSSRRRFKPEVIETNQRSVNGKWTGGSGQHIIPDTPEVNHASQPGSLGANQRSLSWDTSSQLPESKFSYASLLRRQETRRHSFRVPELPSIPSNSSEESEGSSGPSSPSSIPTRRTLKPNENPETSRAVRESCDGQFSDYLLSLAARSAQNQLKEQALAAFPNEQVYQPVDHFAINEEDREFEEEPWGYPQKHHLKSRRQSSADLSWELEYMRQHKEDAEQRLRAMIVSGRSSLGSARRDKAPKRLGISPPMLGNDILIPWSLSPDGTLCESTSVDKSPRATQDPCTGCGGLWCATNRASGGQGSGLWMGTCHKDEGHEYSSRASNGIATPTLHSDGNQGRSQRLPGPLKGLEESLAEPKKRSGLSSTPEKTIDDEFHDGFVTQIYNYLSLGYPSIARDYDYELSRISAISVESLRQDDLHADARGYVVAPKDDTPVACMRWKALRLYIREWARQQPSMAEDETGLEAWGVPERRGSWAF